MKIDWKHLATTDGYKSLKAAYVKSVLRERKLNRSTDDLHKTFNKAISRAKQHAHFLGNSLEEVLNVLEIKRAERKHNWDSFYSDYHLRTGPFSRLSRNDARFFDISLMVISFISASRLICN